MGRTGALPPLTLPPGALRTFHAVLRVLHQRIGYRSLRLIATEINRSGVSRTTVRNVFSGDGLPAYEPAMAVVDYMLREIRRKTGNDHDEILDNETRQFEKLWQAARMAQDPPPERSATDPIGALIAREYKKLTDQGCEGPRELFIALSMELASRYEIEMDSLQLSEHMIRIRKSATTENGQAGAR